MQKNHFLTILILIGMFLLSAVPIKSQTELKDEMRMPWATSQKDFFREWLALGGFPNQDGKGFDTDFLQEHEYGYGIDRLLHPPGWMFLKNLIPQKIYRE